MINRISIVMGSQSDLETVKEAVDLLKQFSVGFEVKVLSAHRSPEELVRYIKGAEKKGIKVFIAVAGGAAALPGVISSYTTLPVIGVPVETKAFKGLDSILSIIQMPKGVPVGCMALGSSGAVNAVLFALEILSLSDKKLSLRLKRYKRDMSDRIRKTKIKLL
ncbi:MAG: 5-(carboxyamino)imidazole ribonucleotide mutase [Candidatus Omnitrophica bacterium]|nr:5-(carboxyamino)imidazole ribonucleotide mutase [Candidatus Omnitrophota bacterium]